MKAKGKYHLDDIIEITGLESRMIYTCNLYPCTMCKYKSRCDKFIEERYQAIPNDYALPKHYKPTNNWLKLHGLPVIRNNYIKRSK